MSIFDYYDHDIKKIALAKSLAESTYPQQLQEQNILFNEVQPVIPVNNLFTMKQVREAGQLGFKLGSSALFPYTLEEVYEGEETKGNIYALRNQKIVAKKLNSLTNGNYTQNKVSDLFGRGQELRFELPIEGGKLVGTRVSYDQEQENKKKTEVMLPKNQLFN
jgi:hypothetical protein